jgi:glycosyltransferase involved in cell wall biosynthesis
MTNRPLISVIVPAYNASATIAEAVGSAVDQGYEPMEVIVVDDGSSDDTGAIAESLGGAVRVLRIPHQGRAAARNTALRASRGELIALLDADDVWLPGKLERQASVMSAHPEVDVTYCGVKSGFDTGDERPPFPASSTVDMTRALLLHPSAIFASQSSLLVRREAIARVGDYHPALSPVEDLDYVLRLSLTARFMPIHQTLVTYRSRAATSEEIQRAATSTFEVLRSFFAQPAAQRYVPLRGRAHGRSAIVFAGMFLQAGDVPRAVEWSLRAVRWDARQLTTVAGLPARRLRRRLRRP